MIRTILACLIAGQAAWCAAASSKALESSGLDVSRSAAPAAAEPSVTGPEAKALPPDLDLFSYFGYPDRPEPSSFRPSRAARGAQVFSMDLNTIKNAYLHTSVGFTTGAGTRISVSGSKASNCPDGGNSCKDKEKFFLVLTSDKGQSFFVRAMDIVNWGIFMSGSRTVTVDGEKYVVKVLANASTPEESVVEIKGPKGVAVKASLKQLGDAVAVKGVDVKLSKVYKLAYGNEITQGPQGAKFTAKMLILLIPFPVADASSYVILDSAEVKPSGTVYDGFEKAYSFHFDNGAFSVYQR